MCTILYLYYVNSIFTHLAQIRQDPGHDALTRLVPAAQRARLALVQPAESAVAVEDVLALEGVEVFVHGLSAYRARLEAV